MTPITSDQCAEKIAEYCMFGLGIRVEHELLRDLIAPFCITLWQPCDFLAQAVAKCKLMEHTIGCALSKRLRIYMYNEHFGYDHLDSTDSVQELILQELLAAKKEIVELKLRWHEVGYYA